MTDTFAFELVTPEKLVYSMEVSSVEVPGADGDFGVLAGHAPLISSIRPGVVSVEHANETESVFITGGFAEVTGERCTVLADEMISLSHLTANDAKERLMQAQQELHNTKNLQEQQHAEKEIVIAEAMIEAISAR